MRRCHLQVLALVLLGQFFGGSKGYGVTLPHVDSQSCFVMQSADNPQSSEFIQTGDSCSTRMAPMSTFKIALLAMAFDAGFFKSTDQNIVWDKKKHARASENKDQTPMSFIRNSVIWVSRRIVDHLGVRRVK